MSDSDESFDILMDIKTYSFESLTDSTYCEELASASPTVHQGQAPVPPTPGPRQELDWRVFVCVGIRLIDKSTHWA